MAGRLLGVGSPIVDLAAALTEAELRAIPGAKGGTEHLSENTLHQLAARRECAVSPGGAAANTIQAAARLGTPAALLGKLGTDGFGRLFRQDLAAAGAETQWLFEAAGQPTGCCLAFVTPDGERTMRSFLGASAFLTEAELKLVPFSRYEWVLLEGYMTEMAFFDPLMTQLKKAGCRIAADLSSFELAARHREKFLALLRDGVSLLFANEEEAAALTGAVLPPEEQLQRLLELVPMAVLKCGPRGALLGEKVAAAGPVRIPAMAAGPVVDTTGAGDYFAAGFLHGLLAGWSLDGAGRCGAMLAGEIITVTGARLPEETWKKIRMQLKNL